MTHGFSCGSTHSDPWVYATHARLYVTKNCLKIDAANSSPLLENDLSECSKSTHPLFPELLRHTVHRPAFLAFLALSGDQSPSCPHLMSLFESLGLTFTMFSRCKSSPWMQSQKARSSTLFHAAVKTTSMTPVVEYSLSWRFRPQFARTRLHFARSVGSLGLQVLPQTRQQS